jgi:DNA-binding HxlR family transcriptional regulator
VLYTRLGELADSGLIAQDNTDAYRLTELGSALSVALDPLDAWARRWADRA